VSYGSLPPPPPEIKFHLSTDLIHSVLSVVLWKIAPSVGLPYLTAPIFTVSAFFTAIPYGPDDFGVKVTGSAPVTVTLGTVLSVAVVACTKSDVFNLENEMLEITEIDIKNTNFIPAFQGASMSIEQAIVAAVNPSQLATTQMEEWGFDQTRLAFIFERPDGATIRTIAGNCYIKNFSLQGGVNTGALVTFEMVVVGAMARTNTPVIGFDVYPLIYPFIYS